MLFMMSCAHNWLCRGVLLLALSASWGCAGPAAAVDELAEARPFAHPRSAVFDTPDQQALAEAWQPLDGPYLPWYAGRNDHRRATYGGQPSVVVEEVYSYTIDRQRQYDGNVRDIYQRHTYRQQTSTLVR